MREPYMNFFVIEIDLNDLLLIDYRCMQSSYKLLNKDNHSTKQSANLIGRQQNSRIFLYVQVKD